MTQYAVVIGINEYESSEWPPLTLAVDSAVKVAEWLVRPDGGGVDPDNVRLLLSPLPPAAPAGASARLATVWANGAARAATSANIEQAIYWPATVTNQMGGDRLFVYFSGHGVMPPSILGDEDTLVPADCTQPTVDPISITSLISYSKFTRFREQYLVFDCCRKSDTGKAVKAVKKFKLNDPDATRPAPDQYVFMATLPGGVTRDAQGLLTDSLLAGLDGAGSAKLWKGSRRYVVQTDKLFAYAKAQVEATLRGLKASAQDLFQVPRQGGEKSDNARMVVSYPDSKFKDVTLTLDLTPTGVLNGCKVTLDGGGPAPLSYAVTSCPFPIQLRPRAYTTRILPTASWEPPWDSKDIELYDDQNWSRTFEPAPGIAASVGSAGQGGPRHAPGPQPVLTVESSDPLAAVELQTVDGNWRVGQVHALGRLTFKSLPAGMYKARIAGADGRTAEQLVRVAVGQEPVTVRLALPDPPDDRLRDQLSAVVTPTVNADGTSGLSELVPAVAAPTANLILALASSAVTAQTAWGHNGGRLRNLNVRAVGGRRPGLERAAGDPDSAFEVQFLARPTPRAEAAPEVPESVRELAVEVVRLQADGPLDPAGRAAEVYRPMRTAVVGAVTLSAADAPGPYQLRVGRYCSTCESVLCWASPQNSAVLPVVLLPGYSAQIQIDQQADGRVNLYRCYPRLTEAAEGEIDRIRRVLDAQRFLQDGGRDIALELLAPYLQEPLDPVAACLYAGTLLAAGRTEEFRRLDLGRLLVDRFTDLPDGYVFMAVREELGERPIQARELYGLALDRGPPMLARGFEFLAGAVGRLKLGQPRAAELVALRPRLSAGRLWTAWTASRE